MVGPVVKIDDGSAAAPRQPALARPAAVRAAAAARRRLGRLPDAVRAQRVDRVHQPDEDARVHGRRQAGRLDADPRRRRRCSATSSRSRRAPSSSSPRAVTPLRESAPQKLAREARMRERVAEHSWDAAAETIRRSLDAVLVGSRARTTPRRADGGPRHAGGSAIRARCARWLLRAEDRAAQVREKIPATSSGPGEGRALRPPKSIGSRQESDR